MTEPKTYWTIGTEKITDFREVKRRVARGETAIEMSSAEQARRARLKDLQEKWHCQALEKHSRWIAEKAYQNSFEGKAAAARRDAQESGGSRVTFIQPQDAAFNELDAFGPDRTDVFKQ